MKLALSLLAVVALFNAVAAVDSLTEAAAPSVVSAGGVGGQWFHMTVFNGNVEEKDKFCSPPQWDLIRTTIDKAAAGGSSGRRLGGKGQRNSVMAKQGQRQLNGSCPNCGPYCLYIHGGCPKGGRRRRRNLELEDEEEHEMEQRDLQLVALRDSSIKACLVKIPAVDKALVALIPTLKTMEPTCANLVASKRHVTCRQLTTDCGVDDVSLATDSVAIGSVPTRGTTFCVGKDLVTFTAETTFNEGVVTFLVTGSSALGFSSKHVVEQAPFVYHGNTAEEPLAADDYTVSITTSYEPNQAKTFTFSVIEC